EHVRSWPGSDFWLFSPSSSGARKSLRHRRRRLDKFPADDSNHSTLLVFQFGHGRGFGPARRCEIVCSVSAWKSSPQASPASAQARVGRGPFDLRDALLDVANAEPEPLFESAVAH